MKERPILFSGPMVRAIMDGTKTQTRRIVKGADEMFDFLGGDGENTAKSDSITLRHARWKDDDGDVHAPEWIIQSAEYPEEGCAPIGQGYGQPGDRLWVRETWAGHHRYDGHKPRHMPAHRVHYAATEPTGGLIVRPSIFMPRWASRITLEVAGVRVERLQDISEADAVAEGIKRTTVGRLVTFEVPDTDIERLHPVVAYQRLWDSINAKTAPWASNPWVWVLEFRKQSDTQERA